MFKVKLSKFYILEINSDKQSLLAKLNGVKEIWNWPHQISHVPSFFVTKYSTKSLWKSSNISSTHLQKILQVSKMILHQLISLLTSI